MKKFILLTAAFILTAILSFAKTQSIATYIGVDQCITLHLPNIAGEDYANEDVYCGTLKGIVDNTSVDFYCIDIHHNIATDAYQNVDTTNSLVTYILNNYYPYKSLPYTGSLSEAYNEAAAVQLALWAATDTLNISACTPDGGAHTLTAEIQNRALQILSDAQTNAGKIQPFKTLVINIPNQSPSIGSPIQFYVEAYNEVGAPIKNAVINLSVKKSISFLTM